VEQPAVSEPQREAETVRPEEAWRKNAPQPGKPTELVLPKFQVGKLKNGMQVWVSERHELPLVSMNVAFKAGTASEPSGKDGLADFTYELFLEGAGKLDAVGLDSAFGELGTSPAVLTGDDGAVIGLEALTRNADPALALLAEVVQRPRFAKEDFERNKKRHLDGLVAQLGNPGFLSQLAYAEAVFGAGHPYGHIGSGTPKSVGSFTLEDVKGFYKKSVGPQAAALIFVGDVTLAQAQAWGEKHFGKWKGTAKAPVAPKPVEAKARKSVLLVPKEGLNQTIVRMGRPAIQTGHPDEAALELATAVFGGFFGSRLNMNLRENKAYTYGARASIDPRRSVGPVTASSSVRADVTGPAVAEFFNELNGLKSRPITEQELAAAREGLIRSYPGMFETVGGIAGAAAALYFEDQPADRYQKLVSALQSVPAPQVQKAAEKYFDPSMLQVVLVGDPLIVSTQVEPLNLGKLETREYR
jgi:predicted Zn-dependent peptidase